jgi:hypothetical protein
MFIILFKPLFPFDSYNVVLCKISQKHSFSLEQLELGSLN